MARKRRRKASKRVTFHAIAKAIKQTQKQLRAAKKGSSRKRVKKISAQIKRLDSAHQMLMVGCGGGVGKYQAIPPEEGSES
jgi:hypothetical protein